MRRKSREGNPSDRPARHISVPENKVNRRPVKKASIECRETSRARARARLFWYFSLPRLPAKIRTCNLGLLQKHHDGPKSQPLRGRKIARRKTLAQNEKRSCLGPFAQRLSEPRGFRMRVARRCC